MQPKTLTPELSKFVFVPYVSLKTILFIFFSAKMSYILTMYSVTELLVGI